MTQWTFLWLCLSATVALALTLSTFDDSDLVTFHTLPKTRILKWNITYYDRDAVAPGYWFVAPYFIFEGEPSTNRWIPCQIGPHIFDQDGELIWTGSCRFENRNVFNFKVVEIHDTPYLALRKATNPDEPDIDDYTIIMDDKYEDVYAAPLPANDSDTHELQVTEELRGISVVHHQKVLDLSDFGKPEEKLSIDIGGFIEFDLRTGERMYEWSSEGHITLDESMVFSPNDQNPIIDYLHANSVDKTKDGDYLLSARHTDTLYLISGEDGHIIWRLGGKKNDFEMDFKFERQHDARVISMNETHATLSLVNNGADNRVTFEPTSSCMYVQLDLVEMKASLLQRYMRPDGGSSWKRGNIQTLPNSNVFTTWSNGGYMSEFSHDGKLLMEARFAADRFDSYRSFKFPWVSRQPSQPPDLVSYASGVSGSDLSTVFHVSWNGATEVRQWRFYARANAGSPKVEIGSTPRSGFETSFIVPGYMSWVSAEAIDSKGEVLGSTKDDVLTAPPEYWPKGVKMPIPDNPETFIATPETEPETEVERSEPSAALMVAVFFLGLIFGSSTFAVFACFPSLRRHIPWFQSKTVYSKVQSDENSTHLSG